MTLLLKNKTNKATNDDYLTSNIFLFHLLIYSLRDEGILLEIIGIYRSLQSLLFPFFLFASFSYIMKDALGFQTLIDSKVPELKNHLLSDLAAILFKCPTRHLIYMHVESAKSFKNQFICFSLNACHLKFAYSLINKCMIFTKHL